MFVEQLGVPNRPKWHAGAKTLVLEPAEEGHAADRVGSRRGFSARGAGRGSSGGGRRGGNGRGGVGVDVDVGDGAGGADPRGPDFRYDEWICALAKSAAGDGVGILNPANLQPVGLPLQVMRDFLFLAGLAIRVRSLPCWIDHLSDLWPGRH